MAFYVFRVLNCLHEYQNRLKSAHVLKVHSPISTLRIYSKELVVQEDIISSVLLKFFNKEICVINSGPRSGGEVVIQTTMKFFAMQTTDILNIEILIINISYQYHKWFHSFEFIKY